MTQYEREKPEIQTLIDQGYGYVIVKRVDIEATFHEEPENVPIPDPPECDEGYVRASVEQRGGNYIGVYELDGEERTIPLNRVRPTKPIGVGVLLDD